MGSGTQEGLHVKIFAGISQCQLKLKRLYRL